MDRAQENSGRFILSKKTETYKLMSVRKAKKGKSRPYVFCVFSCFLVAIIPH